MTRTALPILFMMLSALLPARAADLPTLGDPADTVLSPQEERQIGAEVFKQIRARGVVVDDALLNAYINDLGIRLMSSASGTRFAPNLVIIDNPNINAFTVPGGYIAVFSGLMLAAENESELAGVIAHEIAHTTQRHIAQMVAAQAGNSLTAVAGFIAGILLGAVDPQLGAAVATAGIAGAAQSSINYTRMHEREADRIALETLRRAGVDASGMVTFFEKLQRRAGNSPGRQFEFLRTHPMSGERISSIKNRLDGHPTGATDSQSFRLARARLAALVGRDGLRLDEKTNAYRSAIAAQRNGQYATAVKILDPLYRDEPGNRWFGLPLARALHNSGDPQKADDILSELIALHPDDGNLLRVSIDWLLDRGDAQTAYQAARNAVESNPQDPTAALAFSKAARANGRPLEQHEQLGRYFLLNGNLSAAHQEFETAFTHTAGNPRAQARLESALQDIERQATPRRGD
ncbi:M48 family metalloprotease [Guyparkeria sp. 1SP6A2]|nr:M48 family metalloprotease [Guyparkeria sp. 1SP6A2]